MAAGSPFVVLESPAGVGLEHCVAGAAHGIVSRDRRRDQVDAGEYIGDRIAKNRCTRSARVDLDPGPASRHRAAEIVNDVILDDGVGAVFLVDAIGLRRVMRNVAADQD